MTNAQTATALRCAADLIATGRAGKDPVTEACESVSDLVGFDGYLVACLRLSAADIRPNDVLTGEGREVRMLDAAARLEEA